MSLITSITTASRLPLVAALASLALTATVAPSSAYGEFPETPQVQVSGHAVETHRLDRAKVEVRIKTRRDDLEGVTADLAERSTRLMAILEEKGFRRAELSTFGPKSEEAWKIVRNDKGIETERTRLGVDGAWGVRLTLDGIDEPNGRERLAAFVTAAGQGGAEIERMEFSLSNFREIQARLDRRAAKDAMEKARELIQATGAKPGRLLKLTDTHHQSGGNAADLMRMPPVAYKSIPVLAGETTVEAVTEVTVEILSR